MPLNKLHSVEVRYFFCTLPPPPFPIPLLVFSILALTQMTFVCARHSKLHCATDESVQQIAMNNRYALPLHPFLIHSHKAPQIENVQ